MTPSLHHKMLIAHTSFTQLDLSFEMMLSDPSPITRDTFREKIIASDPDSIRAKEIDFLFDILDYNDDDIIDKKDFRIIS